MPAREGKEGEGPVRFTLAGSVPSRPCSYKRRGTRLLPGAEEGKGGRRKRKGGAAGGRAALARRGAAAEVTAGAVTAAR